MTKEIDGHEVLMQIYGPYRNNELFPLGQPLSRVEEICYCAICVHTPKGPISSRELSELIYESGAKFKNIQSTVRQIREKLGDMAIFTGRKGYLSRRAHIEFKFNQRHQPAKNGTEEDVSQING